MVQAAERAGFPCPRTFLPQVESEMCGVARAVGFPLVIKLRFTSGGKGLRVVQDLAELRKQWRLAVEVGARAGRGTLGREGGGDMLRLLGVLAMLGPLFVRSTPDVSAQGVPFVPPRDAAEVLRRLQRLGLPIGGSVAFTAETDPNNLLGRPNG
jgi:hypothetical protein